MCISKWRKSNWISSYAVILNIEFWDRKTYIESKISVVAPGYGNSGEGLVDETEEMCMHLCNGD
jgi:hypothetical protein